MYDFLWCHNQRYLGFSQLRFVSRMFQLFIMFVVLEWGFWVRSFYGLIGFLFLGVLGQGLGLVYFGNEWGQNQWHWCLLNPQHFTKKRDSYYYSMKISHFAPAPSHLLFLPMWQQKSIFFTVWHFGCLILSYNYTCIPWIGHAYEYPTMHFSGIPRHAESTMAYKILTEYFWKFLWKIALWQFC